VAFELRCVAICCVLTVGWSRRGVYRRTYRYKRNSHDAVLPLLLPWSRAGAERRTSGSGGRHSGSGGLRSGSRWPGSRPRGAPRSAAQHQLVHLERSFTGARFAGTWSRAGSLRQSTRGRTLRGRTASEGAASEGAASEGAARGRAARVARRAGHGGDSGRPAGRLRRRSRGSFPRS